MKKTNSTERIRELLESSGDTQADMHHKTGISRATISRYVKGTQEPNQESLNKIANAYMVSPAWLMGYDVAIKPINDKDILEKLSKMTEQDKKFVLQIINYLIERG